MKIVVCCKWELDEADVMVSPDGSVDFRHARGKISEYDRNAIEAARTISSMFGDCTPVGLSVGSDDSKPVAKDALSRGLEEMYWVHGSETLDGHATAVAIANAVCCIDGAAVVACAEGSGDELARQTAPRVAALLGIPCVTSVKEIVSADDNLVVKRRLEDCIETVSVETPCVLGILPECADAPIPGMKAILGAKKKPVTELLLADMLNGTKAASVRSAQNGILSNRKAVRIEGETPEDAVQQLVDVLIREGVL